MNYKDAVEYINCTDWFTSILGLDRIKELMDHLGNPQDSLRFVHIAGTNGKGSTAAMISSILEKAGYRTGLYISPYIKEFNERIQINHKNISDEELAEITTEIQPVADAMGDHPTVFELITAIALLYFSRKKCDIVVLEVGLGGEMDATNLIKESDVSVITAIDYDHTQILGPTLTDIAGAKAGIIKENGIVVNYGNQEEANKVIEEVCKEKHARLITPEFDRIQVESCSVDGQTISYKEYVNLFLPLPGVYQKYNLAVSLTAIDELISIGFHISKENVREGIQSTVWPARFEVLGRDPIFIVDGGHNPHGVKGTTDSLKTYFPNKKMVFLLGIMADKDVDCVLSMIAPLAKKVYTVIPHNNRAMDNIMLADKLKSLGIEAEPCDSVEDGVRIALKTGKDEVVVAMGSLYMSGDVIAAYNRICCKEN